MVIPGRVDAIVIDFAKVIDVVLHDLLLSKLDKTVIDKIYIWSTAKVKVGEATSGIVHVTSGVAQGSVIRPLLFLIYINDLSLHSGIKNKITRE